MTSKKKVKFEETTYSYDELLNLKFKLILNTDYYVKEKGIWMNKSDDEEYMKDLINRSEEVKIVGIIKQNEEAIGGSNSYGMVGYQKDLMEHLVNKINEQEIVKEQKANEEIQLVLILII